jgi:hypothetical protein
MFARDHLALAARWARQQLREGPKSAATRRQLRQLIEASDALRLDMSIEPEPLADNVVSIQDFRRRA